MYGRIHIYLYIHKDIFVCMHTDTEVHGLFIRWFPQIPNIVGNFGEGTAWHRFRGTYLVNEGW